LLFSGVALATLRLADWRYRLLAIWFWGATIGLSWLSPFPPEGHRSLPGFAACAILIGLAFDRGIAAWARVAPRRERVIAVIAAVPLAASLAAEAAFYVGDYMYADLSPWEDKLSRYILSTNPGRQIDLVPGGQHIRLALFFATDIGRRNGYDLQLRAVDQLPDVRPRPDGVSFVVNGDREGWIPVLRSLYPNGNVSELRATDPRVTSPGFHLAVRTPVMFTAYEIEPAELEQYRGLRLGLTDARGIRAQLRVPSLSLPATLPADMTYPVQAEWRGWLQRDPYERGADTLQSTGSIVPSVRLGDRVVQLSATPTKVELPTGGQPLLATARLTAATDTVEVQWDGLPRRDAAEIQETVLNRGDRRPPMHAFPLDQASTWPDAPRVRVEWLAADGQSTLRTDYDVMISDWGLIYRQPAPPPLVVRYRGDVEVSAEGTYEFRVVADAGPVRLVVDGNQLVPAVGPAAGGEPNRATSRLTVGRHSVLVERTWRDGSQLELRWRPPGGEWAVVPPDAFVPIPWP
jgi:hypothetical protein